MSRLSAVYVTELRCPYCEKSFAENFSIARLLEHVKLHRSKSLTKMISYLKEIEDNHIIRDSKQAYNKTILRKKRMQMYDKKSIALYKLSKEFLLPDDVLLRLFETCTISHTPDHEKSNVEMWRLREYLYHGFYLANKKVDPPKWVVNVAEKYAT